MLAIFFRNHSGSCTAQGFFITTGILATLCYNVALMMQFVLTICFSVSERTLARRFEPFFHLAAMSFPLTLGIVGLVWDIFNPIEVEWGDANDNNNIEERWSYENYLQWIGGNMTVEQIGAAIPSCFINSFPPNCVTDYDPDWNETSDSQDEGGVGFFASGDQNGLVLFEEQPCTRGENATLWSQLFLFPYMVCLLLIMVCVVTILVTVWRRERSSLRFRPEVALQRQQARNTQNQNHQDESAENDRSSKRSSNARFSWGALRESLQGRISRVSIAPDERMKMTRMVYFQSLLYGFAFINTFVWVFAWAINPQYWNTIVFESFVSLQGKNVHG